MRNCFRLGSNTSEVRSVRPGIAEVEETHVAAPAAECLPCLGVHETDCTSISGGEMFEERDSLFRTTVETMWSSIGDQRA